MKKLICMLAVVLASGATFSSCTEEEVTPNTTMNGGGNVLDPK